MRGALRQASPDVPREDPGPGSGMEQRQPQGYVWTLRNGRAVRFEWFNSHAEALEAVGLRE
jgi:hypothetical protein